MGKILGMDMVYDGKFFCQYDISAELGEKKITHPKRIYLSTQYAALILA